MSDISYKYDGAAHGVPTDVAYTVSGLQSGHQATIVLSSKTVTHVKDDAISMIESVKVIDGSGADVTDQYTIKTSGKLSITPRKITLQSHSASKRYDGKTLVRTDITWTGDKMVGDDSIYWDDFASKTRVGKVKNEFSWHFGAGVTEIEKSNYEVTTKYGTLEIKARGDSTKTGVEDHWPMLFGGGGMLLVAGFAIMNVLRKKNNVNG